MSAASQSKERVEVKAAGSAAERGSSPYVGLVPFSEADSEFFYGRGEESKIIAANLRGARLTLLYGPSGVGKSSILRAGVVAPLTAIAQHDRTERGAPDFAVVFFNLWSTDPLDGLSKEIRKSVKRSLGQKTIDPLPPALRLLEIIKAWTERYGIELLIILDQFEEYFLYNEGESGEGTFAYEFPEAVNDCTLRARFLLSMRDDTLSKLDRFKGSIPTLFDHRLQIEHLDLASAYEAIVEPVKKYNKLYAQDNPFKFDREFEPDERERLLTNQLDEEKQFLLNQVLSKVQVGKVSIGVTGQGVVTKSEEADAAGTAPSKIAIEAPYLQLVMTRIWHDEDTTESHELNFATYEKLGGAQKIVEQHLDKVMERLSEEEQDAGAAVFYYLVTPSGTKIAHTVKTLAKYTGLPQARIKQLLDKLLNIREEKEEYRILRRVTQRLGKEEIDAYEVYHDALAAAVLAWSEKHKNEQDKKRALDVAFKRLRKAMIWAAALMILISLIWAFFYKRERYFTNEVQEREQLLFSELQSRNSNRESNKETLQALVFLTSGSAQEKDAAVKTLQRKIELEEIDPDLVPLIEPILLQVAKWEPETQTAIEAEKTAKQIAQPIQDTRLSPRVYIQIQDDEQLPLATSLQRALNETQLRDIPNVRPRIIAPGIENVGIRRNIEFTELRYFHQSDLERQIGEQLIQILNRAGLQDIQLKPVGGYEKNPNIRPNHFELWLSADVH